MFFSLAQLIYLAYKDYKFQYATNKDFVIVAIISLIYILFAGLINIENILLITFVSAIFYLLKIYKIGDLITFIIISITWPFTIVEFLTALTIGFIISFILNYKKNDLTYFLPYFLIGFILTGVITWILI